MNFIKKHLISITILGLIILDQVSKIFLAKDITIIEGIIKFTYTENTGGAFGIFSSSTIAIIIFNIIILFMVARFLILQKERMNNLTIIALTLILGGGLGNLIDRIFRGYVVDFIDITDLFQFPIFNFADIILTIGWVLLVIGVILTTIKNKE